MRWLRSNRIQSYLGGNLQRDPNTDGYCEVVLDRGRNTINLGTIWRTCGNMGVAATGQIGQRYQRQSSDTIDTWRTRPHRVYLDAEEWYQTLPYAAQTVAVELTEDAQSLVDFEHPKQAVYVFGPEDGSVSDSVLTKCQFKVQIPMAGPGNCLNQAQAVAMVLWDRRLKLGLV